MRPYDVITVQARGIRTGDRIAIGGHSYEVETIGLPMREQGREIAFVGGARLTLPPDAPVTAIRTRRGT